MVISDSTTRHERDTAEEVTMNRRLTIAVGLAAGVTAAAALATPAFAQGGPPEGAGTGTGTGTLTGTCTLTGGTPWRDGTGAGQAARPGTTTTRQRAGTPARQGAGTATRQGQSQRGQGRGQRGQGQKRQGTPGTTTAPQGTLTAAQRAELAAMAEEEKVAHDLYLALAATYPAVTQFARIATSEARHLAAVQSLLARYGVADPTAGKDAGEFASAQMQALYDGLLAGATTSAQALAAGVTVEKADIADLREALSGLTAPDVTAVYTNLLRGSQQHLAAFSG